MNAADKIIVKTDQLITVSGSVEGQISKTRAAFSDIEKTIRNTSSYWDGDGHNAFLNTYLGRLARINEALARFEENVTDLRTIAGVYEKADREVQDSIPSLPNDIIL